MREVNVTHAIEHDSGLVWDSLSRFDGFLEWATGGEGELRAEGDGVGMIRHLKLSVGDIGERLTEIDPGNMTIGYALAYGEPLGMKEYQALVQVMPLSEGSCEIRWHGMFEAVAGLDEDEVAENLAASYLGMTNALDRFLAGLSSS